MFLLFLVLFALAFSCAALALLLFIFYCCCLFGLIPFLPLLLIYIATAVGTIVFFVNVLIGGE
jgi:hypothetical protein